MHFSQLTKDSKNLTFDRLGSGIATGRSFEIMTHSLMQDLLIVKIEGIDELFSVDVPSIVEDIIKAKEDN